MGDSSLMASGRVHFTRRGQGRSLILIHGILSSSFVWRRNIDALARHFDVVALDLMGHGGSDMVEGETYTRESLRRFMTEFMDTIGIRKASFVGHSWGGGIAVDLARAHPERVEKLVLIDSTGYPGGNRLAEWLITRCGILAPLLGPFGKFLVRGALARSVFFDRDLMTEEEVDGWLRSVRSSVGSLSKLRNYEMIMDSEIRKVSHPTLIIWGKEDRVMPHELAERFHRDIDRSILKVIDRCGHNPQEEKPEEVNRVIRDFLLRRDG
ncbi:alpha/beta fold hydrolase [Candidatus Moduliflexota bacterium]